MGNSNWRDVPKPHGVAQLPVDPRGYPIFFVIQPPPGRALNFRAIDPEKYRECAAKRLCAVCGLPLGWWIDFIGGPMCVANRIFGDPPLHRECADYSIRVCPFLSSTMEYSIERGRPVEAGFIGDHNVITKRPDRMVIYRTRTYELIETGTKPVFRAGPHKSLEWLTHDGKPLDDEQRLQTHILCHAVKGILCLRCHRLSKEANDVEQRYCPYCQKFHFGASAVIAA